MFLFINRLKRGTLVYVKKELNPQKVFSDDQGRYIAIEIMHQGKKILIVNIYAPKGAKTVFFSRIEETYRKCKL